MDKGGSHGGTGSRNPPVKYNQPSNPGPGGMGAIKKLAAGKVDSGPGPAQNAVGRYKTP